MNYMMELDTTFVKNKQHTHREVSVRTHSSRQKKLSSTKGKMDIAKPTKTNNSGMPYTILLIKLMAYIW